MFIYDGKRSHLLQVIQEHGKGRLILLVQSLLLLKVSYHFELPTEHTGNLTIQPGCKPVDGCTKLLLVKSNCITA